MPSCESRELSCPIFLLNEKSNLITSHFILMMSLMTFKAIKIWTKYSEIWSNLYLRETNDLSVCQISLLSLHSWHSTVFRVNSRSSSFLGKILKKFSSLPSFMNLSVIYWLQGNFNYSEHCFFPVCSCFCLSFVLFCPLGPLLSQCVGLLFSVFIYHWIKSILFSIFK